MPEGPEIRLAADRIARILVGAELVEVFFGFERLKSFEKRLAGCHVTRVDTRGKAMLTRFSNGLTLYSHNQLYGRWYTTKRGTVPRTGRSLRVALHTPAHTAWLYSASDVDLLTEAALRKHPFLRRIGPDILSESLTPEGICERLADSRFRGRSLAALYLDQAFLAGIGNYLRSEILFTAGLHPAAKPKQLSSSQVMKLARQTIALSRRSYRTRGLTVTAAMAKAAKAKGLPRGQYRFWVFGREGQPCPVCSIPVERISAGSRGLFLCPACQPLIQLGT